MQFIQTAQPAQTLPAEPRTTLVQFKKTDSRAVIPTRGTADSAGWDLYALQDTLVSPYHAGATSVPTGIAVQLPTGTYGRLALRSGFSMRTGAVVTAGVIDIDYTGEIKVLVVPQLTVLRGQPPELRVADFTIAAGERFAQLVVEKVDMSPAVVVTQFADTYGVHTGFGSTGN